MLVQNGSSGAFRLQMRGCKIHLVILRKVGDRVIAGWWADERSTDSRFVLLCSNERQSPIGGLPPGTPGSSALRALSAGAVQARFALSAAFSPRLDILPPPQRRLWDELAALPPEFTLYGGTAIALHLGHRQSDDFDFFSNRPLDPMRLVPELAFLAGATVTQRAPNTLGCIVDRDGPVRVSFFGVPDLRRLAPALIAPDNGLPVAALLDLAGTKAAVVQIRAEAKDYIDIDALLRDGRIDLPTALAGARAIYGAQFNPQITLKALVYFEDGNVRDLPRELKDRLVRAVCAVDLNRLPMIQACG